MSCNKYHGVMNDIESIITEYLNCKALHECAA